MDKMKQLSLICILFIFQHSEAFEIFPEFQRLVGIAREKVRLKREEVRKLEESGEIPTSLDKIELY